MQDHMNPGKSQCGRDITVGRKKIKRKRGGWEWSGKRAKESILRETTAFDARRVLPRALGAPGVTFVMTEAGVMLPRSSGVLMLEARAISRPAGRGPVVSVGADGTEAPGQRARRRTQLSWNI